MPIGSLPAPKNKQNNEKNESSSGFTISFSVTPTTTLLRTLSLYLDSLPMNLQSLGFLTLSIFLLPWTGQVNGGEQKRQMNYLGDANELRADVPEFYTSCIVHGFVRYDIFPRGSLCSLPVPPPVCARPRELWGRDDVSHSPTGFLQGTYTRTYIRKRLESFNSRPSNAASSSVASRYLRHFQCI